MKLLRHDMSSAEFDVQVREWEPRFQAIADELHAATTRELLHGDPRLAETYAAASIRWYERALAARHGFLLVGPEHMRDARYVSLPLQRLLDRAVGLGRALLDVNDLVERTGIEV